MNINYDKDLEKIKKLKWLPWIGDKFDTAEPRLMIFGESYYIDEEKELYPAFFKKRSCTRELIKNNHRFEKGEMDCDKVLDNLERAIFNVSELTVEDKRYYSDFFTYTVIVQRALESIQERPTYEDYYKGWQIAKETMKLLKPDVIIVIGVESFYGFCEVFENEKILCKCDYEKISNTYPRKAKIELEGKTMPVIFIKHTAKYFSWAKWHDFLIKEKLVKNFIKKAKNK